jgi:2'-5' RNA ligase
MAAGERARVFFAVWPDEPVRDALSAAALRAQAECGGRATAAEKIHLTLFFVGDVERARIAELERIAKAICGAPFELETDVLGYWRHNRIVWAGTRVTPAALTRLAADLTTRLVAAGYRAEDRAYAPHVTLVRNARRAPLETSLRMPAWHAQEFVLAESARGRYDVVSRWPLARPL